MMRFVRIAFCAALVAICPAIPLFAGPPLVTDETGTPGANGWEVNASDNVTKTRDDLTVAAPYLDLNYGHSEYDQFKAEFPLVNFVDPEDGGQPHAGVGDILIGYKYRYLEEDQIGFSASFYTQMLLPTGNKELGIGQGLTELPELFQVSKHFFDKKLYVYAETGYYFSLSGSRYDAFDYGLAAEWEVNKKLSLMGEVGGMDFPGHGMPDNPFFNIGFGYKFSDQVSLIGSAGRSFRNREFDVPEFTSFLGFNFTGSFNKKSGAGGGNPNPAGEKPVD